MAHEGATREQSSIDARIKLNILHKPEADSMLMGKPSKLSQEVSKMKDPITKKLNWLSYHLFIWSCLRKVQMQMYSTQRKL